jgi:hypothetical protein
VADPDYPYLAEDAEDRRAALAAATALFAPRLSDQFGDTTGYLKLAGEAYRWLRHRDTLHAVSITLIPGTPYPEGTSPVSTTFDLSDTDSVSFTLSGLDAKGAPVDAPVDTWTWTLADPDASGAVLTPSADTLSASVSAGVPDTNLLLTVTGASSGLTGAEAIVVQATAAATVGLVAGTPVPETPAAPAAPAAPPVA